MKRTDYRKRCRNHTVLILLSVILLQVISGCKADGEGTLPGESGDAGEQPADADSIMAFGTVVASGIHEVHLPWSGRVKEIPVWVGKSVQRDDILAVFDENDRILALESARLASEGARGRLEESSSRLGSLEVSLREAAGRLERTRKLVAGGSVSAQDLSSLQAGYDSLIHDRDAARWARSVFQGEAELAASEEKRLVERFTDGYFNSNILVSPFEKAVVVEISQRAGAEIEAGSLLMILHDSDSLLVEADLPEEFIRDVEIGSMAKVIPVADPQRSYSGTVIEIAGLAVLENGENVVKTRIRLEDLDDFLREGFNVDVEI